MARKILLLAVQTDLVSEDLERSLETTLTMKIRAADSGERDTAELIRLDAHVVSVLDVDEAFRR